LPLSEDELDTLYRASETIGASLDVQEVRVLLLKEAQRAIQSDAAVVLLGKARPDHGWASSAALIDSVSKNGRPEYTDRAMCVPIRAGEKLLGVVVLWREVGRSSFTASDEKLLFVLASQAGVALERARLHRHETRRLQMEQELTIAKQIQLTLVPTSPPNVPGWSFAAAYHAARQVGGDFYDFMNQDIAAGRLGVAIADVTGKGVPAGLMMAYSRAALRAGSMDAANPGEVLERTNRLIMQEHRAGLFVSAFYAEIELDSGRLSYASAGHDAPLWIKATGSKVIDLEAPGVILGAYNHAGIEWRSIVVEPTDTVLLYTDGVTEARSEDREFFGEERLKSVAAAAVTGGGSARSVLDSVLLSIAQFCGDAEQADDLTMVAVQREPDA
jgi:serine phosphatase RsbU (regulator of sigma subunit)